MQCGVDFSSMHMLRLIARLGINHVGDEAANSMHETAVPLVSSCEVGRDSSSALVNGVNGIFGDLIGPLVEGPMGRRSDAGFDIKASGMAFNLSDGNGMRAFKHDGLPYESPDISIFVVAPRLVVDVVA